MEPFSNTSGKLAEGQEVGMPEKGKSFLGHDPLLISDLGYDPVYSHIRTVL
jgi:hypothetical protein